MRTLRTLVRGTAVATLVACAANIGAAQSIVAAPTLSNNAKAQLENTAGAVTEPVRMSPRPPFLPPPQMSRRKAIILGMVIGGAAGATAGYFIAHDSCDSCDDSGPVVLVSSVGAVAGAVLGGFVAAQNSPGPAQSSLRSTSTRFLALPHPVASFHLATFR